MLMEGNPSICGFTLLKLFKIITQSLLFSDFNIQGHYIKKTSTLLHLLETAGVPDKCVFTLSVQHCPQWL